jgi:uncharacterized membrane protein (UPF0127 family)
MHRFLFLFAIFSLFAAQIEIQQHVLDVEIADTPAERERGLMGRRELPDGTGMLFIYPEPDILNFWMKNTLIPLSIAFFDEDRVLINILDMDLPKEDPLPIYSSDGPAKYALEVRQGWFDERNIGPGAKFSFLDQ